MVIPIMVGYGKVERSNLSTLHSKLFFPLTMTTMTISLHRLPIGAMLHESTRPRPGLTLVLG